MMLSLLSCCLRAKRGLCYTKLWQVKESKSTAHPSRSIMMGYLDQVQLNITSSCSFLDGQSLSLLKSLRCEFYSTTTTKTTQPLFSAVSNLKSTRRRLAEAKTKALEWLDESQSARRRLAEAKTKALELLDASRIPLGSYEQKHYQEARNAVRSLVEIARDPESVNLCLSLIDRVAQEVPLASNNNDKLQYYSNWILLRMNFPLLLQKWTATDGSPEALVQKILTLSRLFNAVSIGNIVDAVIKNLHPKTAPFVAQGLLDFVKKEASMNQTEHNNNSTNLLGHYAVQIYSQVLHAWAKSGLPPSKMEAFVQDMRNDGVAPSVVTYNILLRYWGGRGQTLKIKEIMDAMKQEGLTPNLASLSQAIYGYALVGWTDRAEELLARMVQQEKVEKPKDVTLVGESTQNILKAYRRILDTKAADWAKEKAVVRATSLFQGIQERVAFAEDQKKKLAATLMDIYARANLHEQVEAVVSDPTQLDPIRLSILIKAMGKADRAEQATDLLKLTLRSKHGKPTVEVFTTLINAWSESSQPDFIEKAFEVLRLMEEDPKCIELGLRPHVVTFSAFLKCISMSNSNDAGKIAETTLDEMEHRYHEGERNTKPNVVVYTLVIRACFQAKDFDRAQKILDRMEKSDTPPDTTLYSELLEQLSKIGTAEAAEQAEQLLAKMKLATNPRIKPHAFCYRSVLTAFARLGTPDAYKRVWDLYEQMESDNVYPDAAIFNALIVYFSQSSEREHLEKAESLIHTMENSLGIKSDQRTFVPVINGWINAGDMASAQRVFEQHIDAYICRKMDGLKPSPPDFATVMQAFIRSSDLVRATAVLDKMQELHDANQSPAGPDLKMYYSVLNAWKDSTNPDRDTQIARLEALIEKAQRKDS